MVSVFYFCLVLDVRVGNKTEISYLFQFYFTCKQWRHRTTGALGHIDTLGPNLRWAHRLPYLMQTKRIKVCLLFIQTLLHRVVGKGMARYVCIFDWFTGKICMPN